MSKSLENLQIAIENSLQKVAEISQNAELLAAQEARVQLELRTFATGGSGVKDVNGNNLSNYSSAYAKKRQNAGLQTANKDLVFSSDTSVIKDNITVGLSSEKPALGFIKAEGAKIAGYQEEREGAAIFQLNQKEIDIVKEKVRDYTLAAIKEITDTWK
jgi:hypothetical protein